MKKTVTKEVMKQTWVYGSFKITFPDGLVMFDNAYTEVAFVLGKSTSDLLNDFVAQEELLIKAHFNREDLIIETGLRGIVNDLDDLPRSRWINR